MDVFDEFVDPVTLTGLIREALFDLQENQYTLSRWLPNVPVDDIEYEFTKGGLGLPEVSTYRAWDAESPIARREGFGRERGNIPPMSEKIPLNEYDRLRIRGIRDGELLPFIARDAERLARNLGARIELARADALVNGSVSINENGLIQHVDYGRRPGNGNKVAAVAWTDRANSTPIDDLLGWCEDYANVNGVRPGRIVLSTARRADLRMSAQVRGFAYPGIATPPSMVTNDVADAILGGFDLPPIEVYDASVKVNGAVTRLLPTANVLLLPAPGATAGGLPVATDTGATFLGVTAESLEPEYGLEGDQPGIVAAQWRTKDPIRLWTHAACVPLPVLVNPDLTYSVEVA